jgi:hypothetical protein
MAQTELIELRLSNKSSRWYRIGGSALVGVSLLLIVLANDNGQTISTGQAVGLLCGIVAGFLFWRMGRGGIGTITIDDKGIVLDTSALIGFVSWDNFEKAGLVKPFERTMVEGVLTPIGLGKLADQMGLGIAVYNVERYIEARKGRNFRRRLEAMTLKWGNRLASLANVPGAATAIKIIGFKDFPTSGSEAEVLRWYRATYGYEIYISMVGVAEATEIAARIERGRPADVRPIPSQRKVPAGFKICPMCAEQIQEAARICRYCRHSFEMAAQRP